MKINKTSKEYKKLNDFIRGELRRKKINQSSLAYSLNLSQSNISDRLNEKTDWSLWETINVMDILGYELDFHERRKK